MRVASSSGSSRADATSTSVVGHVLALRQELVPGEDQRVVDLRAPSNITTCLSRGSLLRCASIFFDCSSFSTSATSDSEWWTMYCTSGGEQVV